MKSYRVYCFDGASRIMSVEVVEAPNDVEAMIAAQRFECFRVEVWDCDRVVGRYQRTEP